MAVEARATRVAGHGHGGDAVDVLTFAVMVPDPKAAAATDRQSLLRRRRQWRACPEVAHGVRERLAGKDPTLMGRWPSPFCSACSQRLGTRPPWGARPGTLRHRHHARLGTAAFAHGDEDHGAPVQGAALIEPRAPGSSDLAQRLPDGAVFVPKPTQRLLVLRTVMTEQGSFHRTVELPGRIIPDPNASGVVQSSVGGRLSAAALWLIPAPRHQGAQGRRARHG